MKTYGFIGLGSMGTPMAAQLADHCAQQGDRLLAWNRSPGRAAPVLAKGATVAPGPAQLVADSDVVVLMPPDLAEVIELTDGPAGLLSRAPGLDGRRAHRQRRQDDNPGPAPRTRAGTRQLHC